jgi:primosomal protein N' (replication factor Y)
MLVRVSVSWNIFDSLTYRYNGDPGELQVGRRVVVPIVNRLTTGWVMEKDSVYKGRVKPVIGVVADDFIPPASFLSFAEAVSGVYFTSAGMVLDASVSPKRKSITNVVFRRDGDVRKLKDVAFKELLELANKETLSFYFPTRGKSGTSSPAEPPPQPLAEKSRGDNGVVHRFLIGYSRLEHYREAIEETLARGRGVLIVAPDNLGAAYVREMLGLPGVDVYNSDEKPALREQVWQSYARHGKAGIVTGGLSAVMLPMTNLGLIVIERAGSALYHRIAFSRFNTHLLARLRAEQEGVPLIEGGSTYTVRAFHGPSRLAVEDNRRTHIAANVHVIPAGAKGIPDAFTEVVNGFFSAGKRLLVVVNRRESAEFLFCPKCKKLVQCPTCDGFLETGESHHVNCVRCGWQNENFNICPKCGDPLTIVENLSVASVKKVIQRKVVETGILTLSAEDLKAHKAAGLKEKANTNRIVIGTLAVVNPYFAGLFDHVIYLRPETMVNLDAYDGAERVYSMVAELREMVRPEGSVEIFSTFHFHYCLKLVNDEDAFFQREIKYRDWFRLPPFCYVYHLEFRAKDLRTLAANMRKVFAKFKDSLGIRRVYLTGREAVRGMVKGEMEAHALPADIRKSNLLNDRNITIDLELI